MPAYKYDLSLQCDHQVLCFTVFDELRFYIRKQLLLVLTALAKLEKIKQKNFHRSGITDPVFSTALCLLEERTGMFRVSGLIFITNSLYINLQDSSNRVQHTFAEMRSQTTSGYLEWSRGTSWDSDTQLISVSSVLYSFNYKHLPQICLSEIWTRFNKSCLGLDNMGWSKLSHLCLFARFQTPERSLKWSFETQAYWVPSTGLVRALGMHSTHLTQTLGIHSTCLTQAFRIEKMY